MAEMTIDERVAWFHLAATTLQVDDLVELKFSLVNLIKEAARLERAIDAKMRAKRNPGMKPAKAE